MQQKANVVYRDCRQAQKESTLNDEINEHVPAALYRAYVSFVLGGIMIKQLEGVCAVAR